MNNNKAHYLILAVLSKEKYEWKLIEVDYESYLTPSVWLENYWEDYKKYRKVVIVDDNILEWR